MNFNLEMLKTIESLNGQRPGLLLHSCCGPCSTVALLRLSPFFNLSVFFYNPNIDSKDEYDLRLAALKKLLSSLPSPPKLIEGIYEPDRFLHEICGQEGEKEGGERCKKCIRLRLLETARLAKNEDFSFFATTLSTGTRKDAGLLFSIGDELSKSENVAFLPSDFKKEGGALKSVSLSKELGLYRQNYCGCIFSKPF